jgi:hypothetical protein
VPVQGCTKKNICVPENLGVNKKAYIKYNISVYKNGICRIQRNSVQPAKVR